MARKQTPSPEPIPSTEAESETSRVMAIGPTTAAIVADAPTGAPVDEAFPAWGEDRIDPSHWGINE